MWIRTFTLLMVILAVVVLTRLRGAVADAPGRHQSNAINPTRKWPRTVRNRRKDDGGKQRAGTAIETQPLGSAYPGSTTLPGSFDTNDFAQQLHPRHRRIRKPICRVRFRRHTSRIQHPGRDQLHSEGGGCHGRSRTVRGRIARLFY